MAVDNSKLLYLLDPAFQIENIAGKPAVGGHIEVFYAGTDVKVITKQNFDGVDNPFKVPLNNDGRAVMLVGPGAKYDIYFYDSFNNLIFSRLNVFAQGEGEGSVSGLTQIFHDDTLTGDGSYHDPLGAIEYTGILPIDVNNDLHLISAQTTRLGVQEPLYFVQDDDERTVIGFSGTIPVPEGTMNESAFGYNDGKITGYNGSAFSAGLDYVAGDNIVINGNEIALDSAITLVDQSNTKGMQLDATEQQFTNLTSNNGSILDASGLYVSDLNMENAANLSKDGLYITGTSSRISVSNDMSDIYGDNHFEIYGYQESGDGVSAMHLGGNDLIVEHGENGFMTASYSLTGACESAVSALNTITATSGNYYPMTGNPSGFLTAHQDISDKLDTTAFSTVSGDFITAIPDNYATKDYVSSSVSSKLDSTAFSTVSSTFLTAHQSLDGLMSASLLEQSGGLITGYNGTAFAGQGGGVTGDYELKEGNGIQLTDDPIHQTTTISVSGDYATNTQLQTVSGEITAMIPTALTGNYVEGNNESGFTITNTAGWINVGENEYLESQAIGIGKSNSGIWLSPNQLEIYGNGLDEIVNASDISALKTLSASKLDTTAAYNPEFAYHDTAISSIDNSALYDTSANARINTLAGRISTLSSEKLDATASSNFYTTANESGFITGVDLTPYQTVEGMTAYQEAGDYYSASNPSGFITGVDLTPYQTTAEMTGYMTTAERADFYTTANESGYITAVPDTYLQNTDLGITDNKVTAISGIVLSAGTELNFGYIEI